MMLRTLLASAAVLVASVVVLAELTDGFQAFTTQAALRLAVQSRPLPVPAAVPLETGRGSMLDLADLRGRWVLVDFIYTRCPTLCQVMGTQFARLQDRFATPLAQDRLALLSISVDPDHDSPAALRAYMARSGDHGSGWTAGRTVDTAGLRRLQRAFGVTVEPDPLGGLAHSTTFYLVDPAGRLVEILDSTQLERVAARLSLALAP